MSMFNMELIFLTCSIDIASYVLSVTGAWTPVEGCFLRTWCSIWFIYDWRSKKGCYSGKYTKARDPKCEIIPCFFLKIYNQNTLLFVACLLLECGQADY